MAENTRDYEVTITEASRELSHKEAVMFKDTTDCLKLDTLTQDSDDKTFTINQVTGYVILNIHNEHSEDKDYTNYVIIDENGQRYVTGSASFGRAFTSIVDEMRDSGEDYGIKVFRLPSKQRQGKEFLTCSLI